MCYGEVLWWILVDMFNNYIILKKCESFVNPNKGRKFLSFPFAVHNGGHKVCGYEIFTKLS